jgi:hypothetical protein
MGQKVAVAELIFVLASVDPDGSIPAPLAGVSSSSCLTHNSSSPQPANLATQPAVFASGSQ